MQRIHLLAFMLALLACLISACAGGADSTANLTTDSAGLTATPGLAELEAPDGFDQSLWLQMKEKFALELAKANALRGAADAPTSEASKVTDFSVTLDENNDALFSWTYRNVGDYDQNSEVNLADITQIALHFMKNTGSPDWRHALAADGDGNGEINLSDITPLAVNFLNNVASYKLRSSATGTTDTWETVESVSFSAGVVPPAGGLVQFTHLLANALLENGSFYRVSPNDGSPGGAPGGGGDLSFGIPSNDVNVSYTTVPQNLIATTGNLVDEVRLTWDAMPGADFYHVFRADAVDGSYSELGQSSLGENTFTDTTCVEGVHYWYTVAGEASGELSEHSDPREGWSNTMPGVPVNVQASDGVSSSGITVTWDKSSGATGYKIFRDTEDYQVGSPADVDTWEDTTIFDTDPHTYWVSAVSYTLESGLSDPDTGYKGVVPTITRVLPEKLYHTDDVTLSATVSGDLPMTYAWDFGGGATPNTSSEESPTVTIAASGSYSGTLTCTNVAGQAVYAFSVGEPLFTELLIVYNSNIPEDLDLVEYYSSLDTGRNIHPDYRLGLPLGAYSATIARPEFESQIRDPIMDFLDANTDIKDNIKYILLMKGLPHQIPGVEEFTSNSTFASVDSELCALYEYDNYPIVCWLWNDSTLMEYPGNGFHLIGDVDFVPNYFPLRDGYNAPHTLNYLVGRLSAYTYADAKLMVDRSLAADTSRNGWVVFDSRPSRLAQDTMVDPVWMYNDADPARDSGEELLVAAGFNVYAEITDDRVTADYVNLPAGAGENIIGYSSWGKHSGFAATYILDTLDFTYRPGACFMSYESFNGTAFSEPISRRGQGQICDFIRMGGTVAIGNVYEPFTLGVGDERWVFDRYLNHGDRWIEAAYKGLRMVSWQEVVIGDPLCRVVAD